MGNCALKPKVLSEAGAHVPEILDDSLLEEQKIEAVKSLRYLLLRDKPDKKMEDDEKITPEKMQVEISPVAETKPPVTEEKADKQTEEDEKITPEKSPLTDDLKTALAEEKSPVIETKLPATMEVKALDDDQKIRKEEAFREEKVIDDVPVKETETDQEVGREAAK